MTHDGRHGRHAITSSECVLCARVFFHDPELVPAYQGHPICQFCVERANLERGVQGAELITYDSGAYP